MKATVFARLEQAVAQAEVCALVTDTSDGRQQFVGAADIDGDISLQEDQLATIKTMMRQDLSGPLGDTSLFVRVYGPPLTLVVVGAVHIAQALVPMAKLAGFDITVIDPREGFVRAGRLDGVHTIAEWPDEAMANLKLDDRTAVVTLTHDPKLDDPALAAALESHAFYIGSLGSTRTHAKRLQRLAGDGFSASDLDRIHGPVGLDIGAKTPTEIAVAILGQIIEVRRRAQATPKAS